MSDIIGYGGGKGAGEQHVHYEAADSLHSISYARVLDLISEGEILGLAHGVQSVYLDGTPVQNADGTNNFQNVTVDFRSGTQSQDYIPGFPSVESETAVGVELKSSAPWTHAITNLGLDAIRITLGVPALSQANTDNGDINGYKIDYQIELSTDGGAYSVVLSSSFDGKTTTAYQRSARIDLPTATTGWNIRVTRLTANANTSAIADITQVISYTEVIDAKLRYPMSAIVGIQVDAKQFQSVPTRAYDLYGRIVQVPSNYDAPTRTYTGIWDGTFKPAWTSNPAWIFRDLILNDRYGLGHRITADQVDKWVLYKIAQYCDVMVPDGKGGTEPRFACNVYLQSQKQAYAVLQDLASIFRGISYWGGGSIMASADMPSDPVYVYTAANVIGGKFSRVGSRKATRYTTALVSWNDMSDMGRAKVEYVEDAEGINRYGIVQVNLTAFGCTSQGQAQRVGRWALATSRLLTDAITFDVGMDGAIALPGQIVRIADPARMGRRNGGRIHSASGRVVTLDKAPTISAGDKLTAILPNGTSETHNVVSVSGNDVTVDADWSTLPSAQSVWSVDNADLVAPLFRIASITEKDATTFTITATQHEPGIYDYVENGVAIVKQSQTSLDVSTQAAPASVTVSAYTVSLQDVQKLALHVSCDPVPGAVAYEGAYKRDNGNWIPIPRQFAPSLDIIDVLEGVFIAKLAAVNSIGVVSVETVSAPTAITASGPYQSASSAYLEAKATTAVDNDAVLKTIAKLHAQIAEMAAADAATKALWANIVGQANAPASNATVGAPPGTFVGSTPATTVEANAANGATANTTISNKPVVNAGADVSVNSTTNSTTVTVVSSRTATISGGNGAVTPSWSVSVGDTGASGSGKIYIRSSSGATVSISASGASGDTVVGVATCTADDSGGMSGSDSFNITANFL